MSGNDVKCLQVILNQAADTQVAASGTGSAGKETTTFGALTKAAVVKFQNKYAAEVLTPVGLTAGTGVVGAKTVAKLNTMVGGTGTTGTGTTGTTQTLPTAAGLTVQVASDNPAAGTVISDGASNVAGSQALIPFLKLTFSTPAGTSAKVTSLKVKRIGVSSDTDLSNVYLYDGNTKIAELTSMTAAVVNFTNAAGLFTVEGAKTITVKGDLYKDSSAGKTIGISLVAATDVTTDASAVNGTFPINGNLMTVAVVTDFGRLTVATTTNSATVDPGITGFEAMKFTLQATNQKIKVSSIKFMQLGSIAKTDVSNMALYAGGTQLGSTVPALAADGTVTFDFSSSPYEIGSGVTKNISLKCDVVGGSTRTIRFSIQKSSDIVAMDANYGVSVTPDVAAIATYTVLDSVATLVNSGNLVISRATDSPSGNVALNSTNVTLAKYNVKAVGEDVKVSSLVIQVATTGTGQVPKNVKVLFDGLQTGLNQSLLYTTTSLSVNFTVPVGQTKTIEIKGDIQAGGANFVSTDTLTASILLGSSNAQRMTSLGTFDFPSANQAGNQLTVSASSLSAARNITYGNIQTVYGAGPIIIGSYLITAGSAEGVSISKITFTDNASSQATTAGTHALGEAYSNLELYYGTTKLGSTVTPNTSDTPGQEYNFYPQGLSLVAGQTIRVDLKGNVMTSPTWGNADGAQLISAEGTGLVTANAANITTAGSVAGQKLTLSSAGVFTGAIDSSRPDAALVAMGQTDVTIGIWKLSADSVEQLTVSKIVMISNNTATSSGMVKNVKLYCGSDAFGSTVDALVTPSAGNPYAPFAGTCVLPKGSYKLVTLKADVADYGTSAFGTGGAGYYTNALDYVEMFLTYGSPITEVSTSNLVVRGAGAVASTTAAASSTAEKMYVYRTILTPTLACTGTCDGSQRGRNASDEIATLTLTGTTLQSAQLRTATSVTDDSVGVTSLATSTLYYDLGATSTHARATTTRYLDDSTAVEWILKYGDGTDYVATNSWVAFKVGTTTSSSPLKDYSRISLWIYPNKVATTSIFLADATTTDRAFANATAVNSATTVVLSADQWNHVDFGLNDGSGGFQATTGSAYIGVRINTSTSTIYVIDDIRLYNDSVTLNITGDTKDSATGTVFYLKTVGGTQVGHGYLAVDGKVKLIPESTITVGSPGTTYKITTNTNTVVATSTTAVETLSMTISRGTPSTAGDIRWFDQGANPDGAITWINAGAAISASLAY
jgi:hypothetical protein